MWTVLLLLCLLYGADATALTTKETTSQPVTTLEPVITTQANTTQSVFGPANITLFGPSDKIPRHATNVTLTCSAMGNPQLDFEWINTPTGAPVTPVSDLGNFTYSQAISFNPRKYKDHDVIECKATNPVLKDASLTATYHFRFTREAELINCIKPPKYVTTKDTTPCTCSFVPPYGAPNKWTIQWTDPSGKILASHTSVRDTLTLPLQALYIQPQYRGLAFSCVVSSLQGEHSRMQYTPRVAYGPENVTLSGPKEKIAQDGSYVNLTCTATSSPAPRFFWRNKPKTFRLLPVQKLSKDTFRQTLTFYSSGDLKDDVVKCRVKNPVRPRVVRAAEYHLQFREASNGPTNVFMLTGTYEDPVKGSYIMLTCLADSSSHALIFEWQGLPGSATPLGCSFETGFSCQTVTFLADAVPDDQSVSCSVHNPDMPEQTQNASFVAGSPTSDAIFEYATLVGAGAAAVMMAGGLGVYGAAKMSSQAKSWPTKSSLPSSAPSSKSPSKSGTILSKANRFLTGKKSQKEKEKESERAILGQPLPVAIGSARPESLEGKRKARLEMKEEELGEDTIYEVTFPTPAMVPKAKASSIEESSYEGIEKYLGISRPTETDAGLTIPGITSMMSQVSPKGVPGMDEGKLGAMGMQGAELAGSVAKSPMVKVAATGLMTATGLSAVQGVAEVTAGVIQAATADSEAKDPISKSIPGHLVAATVASASAAQGDGLGKIGGTVGISESEKTDPISKTFAAGHVLGVKGEGSVSGGLLGKIGESVGVTRAEEKRPGLKTISGTLSGSECGTSHGGMLGQAEGAMGGVWGSSGASLFTGKPSTKG